MSVIRYSAALALVATILGGMPAEGRVIAVAVVIAWALLRPVPMAVPR